MAREKKPTFEQAMSRLEQIVQQIEQGQVSLEESIAKYAEGIGLIRQCRAILESAEKKIQVLSRGGDGELAAEGELEELGEEPSGPPGDDAGGAG